MAKLFLSAFLLMTTTVFAQDDASNTVGSAVNHTTNLSQVFLGLLAMITLIFGLAWVVKRMGYTGGYGSSTQTMRIRSCLPLSSREKILLIQVGNEQLVIGVSPGNINLIKALDTPIESLSENDKPASNFSEKLVKELLSKKLSKSNE